MKRTCVLRRMAAFALSLVLLTVAALATFPAIPENGYVADGAGVLRTDTVEYVVEKGQRLTAATGGAIVVVTVDFLDGKAIDDYAVELFNQWGIGDGEKDNGLLILLAIGEDNYYTLAGSGIQSALPASRIQQFNLDYLEEDFARGDYDAGVRKLFDALYSWFEGYYGQNFAQVGSAAPSEPVYGIQDRYTMHYGPSLGTALMVFILVLVVVLAVVMDYGRYRRYRRRYFGVPGYIYRPFIFGRPPRRRPPHRPHGPHRPSGGSYHGSFGGGYSRGGGAGRSSAPRRTSSGSRSSFGGGRSSFGGGRSGFGGGSSRGGGAGRR